VKGAFVGLIAALAAAPLAAQPVPARADYRARPPEDEVVYFVLPDRFANGDPANDRGGLKGGRLVTGFDPTDKAFYHGGDLKGLIRHLDYIQGLGATAIWVGPIFKNKPVQGPKGQESAGYHGYWITDFTTVDPHFGTEADFKALVDAAHARGMKVYMDIVCNHTADVIRYREGEAAGYAYRSKADYPFTRRGGIDGAAINAGFGGDDDPSPANWAKLTDPAFAYTPYVPKGEEHEKKPDWLNDPIYYHNRGNSNWHGESALYGDFSGLDDLATENPRVVQGMIDIYASWIDRFGVDGFRIDTARHVDPAFWRAFVPAMLARAKADGIPNFHIFGEVATQDIDPGFTARWTHIAALPAVLDMPFASAAVQAVSGRIGTDGIAKVLEEDVLYAGGEKAALQLPTFVGNHDFGRLAMFVKAANPAIGREELLARVRLGYAMVLTLRGVPGIYYGDEQGFAGHGGDQLARQDMFASQVKEYNDEPLVGTDATTAQDNFDPSHPLYREIAALAKLRLATPALTEGLSKIRTSSEKPGLLAVSRFDPASGREVLLAYNTSPAPVTALIEVEARSARFVALAGTCPAAAAAPGAIMLTLPAFGYAVCKAGE
jgi:glycosidase